MKRALIIISTIFISTIFAVIAFIAPAAPAQTLVYQIATNQGNSSLCLNRQYGGTINVITYNCNDPNDDFSFIWLGGACGGGYVTLTCPFSSSDVNMRYNGAAIVEIYAYNFALCLANNGLAGTGILGTCPDQNGNGGSYGTIMILAQVHNFPGWTGSPSTYVVNRYWSNLAGAPRWMCSQGYNQLVKINSSQGLLGSCQWREVRLLSRPGIAGAAFGLARVRPALRTVNGRLRQSVSEVPIQLPARTRPTSIRVSKIDLMCSMCGTVSSRRSTVAGDAALFPACFFPRR